MRRPLAVPLFALSAFAGLAASRSAREGPAAAPPAAGERFVVEAEEALGVSPRIGLLEDGSASARGALRGGAGSPAPDDPDARWIVRTRTAGPFALFARARSASVPGRIRLRLEGGVSDREAGVAGAAWGWVALSGGTMEIPRGGGVLRGWISAGTEVDEILLAPPGEAAPAGPVAAPPGSPYGPLEIDVRDEFMRKEGEASEWKVVEGSFRLSPTVDDDRFVPEKSANPFAYAGRAEPKGVAIALRSGARAESWRDYAVAATARSQGPGEVGLVALAQASGALYAVRADAGRPGSIRWVRRDPDGGERVLASREGSLPDRTWLRLALSLRRGRMRFEVDGVTVLEGEDRSLLCGRPGLFAAGPSEAVFDDVRVAPVSRTGLLGPGGLRGSSHGLGSWREIGDEIGAEGPGPAEIRFSLPPGLVREPEVSGEAWIGDGACLGVALGGDGRGGAAIFRWRAESPFTFRRARQWVERQGGGLLAEGEGGARPGEWVSFRVARRGDRLEAFGAGEPLLGAFAAGDGAGDGIGFVAEGGTVRLRRLAVSDAARVEESAPGIHPVFRREASMAEWAAPEGEWAAARGVPGLFWNRMPFFADVRIDVLKPFDGQAGPISLLLASDGREGKRGYEVSFRREVAAAVPSPPAAPRPPLPVAGGRLVVEVLRDGKRVDQVEFPPASPGSVFAERAGPWILAGMDGKVVWKSRGLDPPAGRRAGVRIEGGGPPPFDRVHVLASNFVNEEFRSPSPDWREGAGIWGMSTRWRCDPSWSWFGGKSERLAAQWLKRPVRGDFVLDFYGAFAMRYDHPPFYEDPGNLDVALSTDGVHPGRGYAFLYGADRGRRTVLWRDGEAVAENREDVPPLIVHGMPPFEGAGGLHRRWFRVTVERRGPDLEMSVDGRRALRFRDPSPLPADRLGIWTMNQGILLARVRLSYEGLGPIPDPVRPNPPAERDPPSAPWPRISSPTHPGAFADFERGLDGFESLGTPHDARLSRVPRGEGWALRAENPRPGGRFGCGIRLSGLDGRLASRLSFDLRLERGVRVDLRVKANGREFLWALGDRGSVPVGVPVLGRIGGAPDDGSWHRVSLDLRGPLAAALATPGISLDEISLGHFREFDVLDAGVGGNSAGAAYELDDVSLSGPGPGRAAFAVSSPSPWARVGAALDGEPGTVPPASAREGPVRVEGEVRGAAFLHAALYGPKGDLLSAVHRRVEGDGEGPRAVFLEPRPGARSGAAAARVRLDDASGVDPATIRVRAAGRSLGVREDPAVAFDAEASEIRADLQALGAEPGPDGALSFAVEAARDFLGNAMRSPAAGSWTFDPAADVRAPDVRIEESPPGPLARRPWEAVESVLSRVEEPGRGAVLTFASPSAGGALGAGIAAGPFEPGRWPFLAFDYRLDPDVDLDLFLSQEGRRWRVEFTDGIDGSGDRAPSIGRVEGAAADGAWHAARIPLFGLLSRAREEGSLADRAASVPVERIDIMDTGWQGNRRASRWSLAGARLLPAAGPGAPPPLRISARDLAGVARVEARWIDPVGAPDGAWSEAPDGRAPAPRGPSGIWRLEARARDRKGNESEPAAAEVFLDATAPAVRSLAPGDGAAFEGSVVAFRVEEPEGLDLGASRFSFGPRTFALDDPAIEAAPGGVFVFRGARAVPGPLVADDGSEIALAVDARDYGGNRGAASWRARADRSLDRSPPLPPLPVALPDAAAVLARLDFEADLGGVAPHDGGAGGARVRREHGGPAGRACLRIEARAKGQTASARLLSAEAGYRVSERPILAFDYRAPDATRFDLLLDVRAVYPENAGRPSEFRFVNVRVLDPDDKENYPLAGTVPGCFADDRWRHLEADLLAMFKAWDPEARDFVVRTILAGDWKDPASPADGAGYWIDNVTVAGREAYRARRFAWSPPEDATGIRGYRLSVDGAPPAPFAGTTWEAKGLPPGPHRIAVSAQDGAGHWGEPGEAAFEVPGR